MTKTEVLEILTECKVSTEKALKRSDLTTAQKKELSYLLTLIKQYTQHIKDNVKETETELLQQYYEQFKAMKENLKTLEANQSIMLRPENELVKVEKVIPEKEQKEETKKERNKVWEIIKNILATLGVVALITLMVMGLKSCDINKTNDEETKPGIEQEADENIRPIEEIDIENYSELMVYSEEVQSLLGETDLSIEEIMYAIRLGNFDSLEDKAIFKDRDEIYTATAGVGEIATKLGSNSIILRDENTDIYVSEEDLQDIIMCVTDNALSLENFASAKTENGYDIYSIVDVCIKGINAGNENDVLYAKVFNDVLARKIAAFTITPDSPISTYYTLLGMYNANSKRILELTSGIGLTSVYGDETRIDGYYGFICVEELEAYLQIGNQNNIFYTDIIDENITNYTQEQTQSR